MPVKGENAKFFCRGKGTHQATGMSIAQVLAKKHAIPQTAEGEEEEQTISRPRMSGGEEQIHEEHATPAPTQPSSTPATRPPAKTYPFKLDPFQQASIDCLERGLHEWFDWPYNCSFQASQSSFPRTLLPVRL